MELVRSELPELVVVGDRLRRLVARSSVPFAVLAGIGADRVGGEVLRSLAFAVFEFARPERAPRPYDLQEIIGPAVGLVVARHAGGRPGALWYLAYAAAVLVSAWIRRALTCAGATTPFELGLSSFCDYGPLDLLAGAVPLLLGLAIGGVVARSISDAVRRGANPFFEAAGAYTAVAVVVELGARAFVFEEASGVTAVQAAWIVGTTLVSGIVAGAVCALRSATPIRTGLALAAVLVVTWLYPLGWSQLVMTAGADWSERPELLLVAVPLLGAAALVFSATVARRRPLAP